MDVDDAREVYLFVSKGETIVHVSKAGSDALKNVSVAYLQAGEIPQFHPYHDRMDGYLSAPTGKSVFGCQHRLDREVLLVSFCLRGFTEDCSVRNGGL